MPMSSQDVRVELIQSTQMSEPNEQGGRHRRVRERSLLGEILVVDRRRQADGAIDVVDEQRAAFQDTQGAIRPVKNVEGPATEFLLDGVAADGIPIVVNAESKGEAGRLCENASSCVISSKIC